MQHVLELKSISYHYPQNKRPILNQCSLTINQGDLVSILGPNGAGKSTMLNCACGLLKPQAGEVLVNGTNINRLQQRDHKNDRLCAAESEINVPTYGF